MRTDDYVEPPMSLLLTVGAVIGALLVGGAWLGTSLADRGSTPDGGSGGAAAAAPDPPSNGGQASATRMARCRHVYRAQAAPLAAAVPALDRWAVHIGAMNKLVVGAITLNQATAFWNQTRKGAEHSIAAYRRAMRHYEYHLTVRCPQWPTAAARAHERPCVRAAGLRDEELAAVDVSIRTWAHHVQDMERLRTGKLSPSAATSMWLMMWHRGVRQLHAYRHAAHAAAAVRCAA
jgi:hypothetical protein